MNFFDLLSIEKKFRERFAPKQTPKKHGIKEKIYGGHARRKLPRPVKLIEISSSNKKALKV
jgi:hypothetical protein